jgi:hypothetical protein
MPRTRIKSPKTKSRQSRPKKKSQKRSRSRSRVRIPVKKGLLEGYHLYDLARDRRKLLMNMIKNNHASYSDIIKRLNVLVIYNKNRHPDISDKVYKDLSYMQKHVPDKFKLSPGSRAKSTSPYKFRKSKSKKRKSKSLKRRKSKSLKRRKSKSRKRR